MATSQPGSQGSVTASLEMATGGQARHVGKTARGLVPGFSVGCCREGLSVQVSRCRHSGVSQPCLSPASVLAVQLWEAPVCGYASMWGLSTYDSFASDSH